MNKKEALQILAIVRTVYPNTKIENPEGMAMAWMMCLEEYTANEVLNAVKFHMNTSKFFPTPSEIRANMVRANIMYGGRRDSQNRLGDGKREMISVNEGEALEEKLERFCRFVGFGYSEENNS